MTKQELFESLLIELENFGSENIRDYIKYFNKDQMEALNIMIADLDEFRSENVEEYEKLLNKV